jgi:putative addiction module component (TIGR02574 family)
MKAEVLMTLEQVISEVSALSPTDQLRLVQEIWDRLPKDVGTQLTPSQQSELDRRWSEYKNDPSTALTEEQFRERIKMVRDR